jgi:hypothetical protein
MDSAELRNRQCSALGEMASMDEPVSRIASTVMEARESTEAETRVSSRTQDERVPSA